MPIARTVVSQHLEVIRKERRHCCRLRKTDQRENLRTDRVDALQPRMMSISRSLQFTDSSNKLRTKESLDFPGSSGSKTFYLQCERSGFDPWLRKISWRREWQPTPVFLPPQKRRLNGTFLEKAMAPHSSTLAWKIPWMEEPGRLQSMWSRRVRHDWVTSLSIFTFMHWRRKWQSTPVFLPGESQGWGHTESDTTEVT